MNSPHDNARPIPSDGEELQFDPELPPACAELRLAFLAEGGKLPGGDTLAGDTLAGDTLAGDTLAGDTLAGDTLAGDTAEHLRSCEACRKFTTGDEAARVRGVASVLRELARTDVTGAMPVDVDALFESALSERGLSAELAVVVSPIARTAVAAPAELDHRVGAALGLHLARRPGGVLRWRWIGTAAAAALVVALHLFMIPPETRSSARPRLVINDVDRPPDWTVDPVASCLYVAGGLPGQPFAAERAPEEHR